MEFRYYIPGFLSIYLFFNSFFDTTFYLITYRERCISELFQNITNSKTIQRLNIIGPFTMYLILKCKTCVLGFL